MRNAILTPRALQQCLGKSVWLSALPIWYQHEMNSHEKFHLQEYATHNNNVPHLIVFNAINLFIPQNHLLYLVWIKLISNFIRNNKQNCTNQSRDLKMKFPIFRNSDRLRFQIMHFGCTTNLGKSFYCNLKSIEMVCEIHPTKNSAFSLCELNPFLIHFWIKFVLIRNSFPHSYVIPNFCHSMFKLNSFISLRYSTSSRIWCICLCLPL